MKAPENLRVGGFYSVEENGEGVKTKTSSPKSKRDSVLDKLTLLGTRITRQVLVDWLLFLHVVELAGSLLTGRLTP